MVTPPPPLPLHTHTILIATAHLPLIPSLLLFPSLFSFPPPLFFFFSDVHRLEYPTGWTPLTHQASLTANNTQATMIKKFQRSSADHDLLIPHLLRTPQALYKTICYMEDHIMERHLLAHPPNQQSNERERDKATPLFIYLFVWDRYLHLVITTAIPPPLPPPSP